MDTKRRLSSSSAVRTQLSCLSLCFASMHFWNSQCRESTLVSLTQNQLHQNIFPLNKLHIRVMKGLQVIKHICECHFWRWEQSTFRWQLSIFPTWKFLGQRCSPGTAASAGQGLHNQIFWMQMKCQTDCLSSFCRKSFPCGIETENLEIVKSEKNVQHDLGLFSGVWHQNLELLSLVVIYSTSKPTNNVSVGPSSVLQRHMLTGKGCSK